MWPKYYITYGEPNFYLVDSYHISSVSPELATNNTVGEWFMMNKPLAREILRENHPYIYFTIKKMCGEVHVEPKDHSDDTNQPEFLKITFNVKNIGMSDWNLKDENQRLLVTKDEAA